MSKVETFWLGTGRMLMSAVLFSLMSLLVKLDTRVSSFLVTFMRFFTGLVILTLMAVVGYIQIKPVNIKWLIVRGIFGTFAVLLLYVGIARIGLGKGTMLNYTYPVFAAALSPLIVGEKNSWKVWLVLIMALIGCYLLLSPKGAFHFKWIELLVLSGALCAGIAVNSIRRLSRTDNPYTIYTAFCLSGVLIMSYPTFKGNLDYGYQTWIILILVGLLATVAQLLMTTAYRHIKVAEGSILAFIVPVLNSILGAWLFKESLGIRNLLGGIIVIVCCTYTSWTKHQEAEGC